MRLSILVDFQERPPVFSWNGPLAPDVLERWMARHRGVLVPDQLVTLWTTVGGGDLFESETILEPFAAPTGDDIDAENERLQSLGMPARLLAFHIGLCVSVVDQATGEIVQLDHTSYAEISRHRTVDDWYHAVLRAEYGLRYGLGSLGER